VKDGNQLVFGQFGQRRHDRQSADKFWNEAKVEGRSSGSACWRIFVASRAGVFFALPQLRQNQYTCRPSRRWMTFSKPMNAPPQMNKMSVVSTRMYSCCGCLRPPWGGTLQIVPSRISAAPACTPSPETSRVMDGPSALRAILSISSIINDAAPGRVSRRNRRFGAAAK